MTANCKRSHNFIASEKELFEKFKSVIECKCKISMWYANWLEGFIIIMIFYCGLMVHITDTRAQKVVSYTSAHITETVFAHDQHWEEQSSLSQPQLYRHSQKHRKWITIQWGITQPVLVRAQPWEEQDTFPALLTFLCLVCTQCPHIFTTQKQYWWDTNSETIHGKLLHSEPD